MSILDRHPAPWKLGSFKAIQDARGNGYDFAILGCQDDDAIRLILAAPELLEVLQALLDPCPLPSKYGKSVKDMSQFRSDWEEKGAKLIARIDGAHVDPTTCSDVLGPYRETDGALCVCGVPQSGHDVRGKRVWRGNVDCRGFKAARIEDGK